MKLHTIIADHLIALSEVIDKVGRNETTFDQLVDQYVIRKGRLLQHDPYPGIAITVPDQIVTNDLADVVSMLTAEVQLRITSHSLAEAYALANACAFNSQIPQDRGASGLDGWQDLSKGIQSFGLRRTREIEEEPDDSRDRLRWHVDYIFECNWNMRP